jgi:phospholipid transport system substrate-binding protein
MNVNLAAADDLADAEKVIQQFNDALIASMKGGKGMGYEGRFKLLEPVVKETIDLSFMCAKSVGKEWKKLSEAQQKDFYETYTKWTVANYASNFNEFNNETFTIASKTAQDKVISVVSAFKTSDETIDFDYRLHKTDQGYRIVDIWIKGVSQLANKRQDFASILQKGGIDQLKKMLLEKIDMFAKKG